MQVRAEAFYAGDSKHDRTMAILMHGDAAFSGQVRRGRGEGGRGKGGERERDGRNQL